MSNYQILSAFEIAQFFLQDAQKRKNEKRKKKYPRNTVQVKKRCPDFSSDDEPKSKRRLFAV